MSISIAFDFLFVVDFVCLSTEYQSKGTLGIAQKPLSLISFFFRWSL